MGRQATETFNCPACNVFTSPYRGTAMRVCAHLIEGHGWSYVAAYELAMDLVQIRAAAQWQIDHAETA